VGRYPNAAGLFGLQRQPAEQLSTVDVGADGLIEPGTQGGQSLTDRRRLIDENGTHPRSPPPLANHRRKILLGGRRSEDDHESRPRARQEAAEQLAVGYDACARVVEIHSRMETRGRQNELVD